MSASAWGTLREAALDLGFADLGAVPARPLDELRAELGGPRTTGLPEWLAEGRHGEMGYTSRTAPQRQDPRAWWPPARTVLVGLVPHDGAGEPGDAAPGDGAGGPRGRIARYAWGRDYHLVVKNMLVALGRRLEQEVPGARWKTGVDHGAAMEKPLAVLAGLGWIGKHGNLLRTRGSSWFFIGVLLTDVALDLFEPFRADHCGTCTACIDACPTGAIVGPQVVDARRCISYVTIELRDAAPRELRASQGDWVFGCDACQDACPWNSHRTREGNARFAPGALGRGPLLRDLLHLDPAGYARATPKSALKRARRAGLVRSAATAAGNAGDTSLGPDLALLLRDAEPSVRRHAAWALGRLGGPPARAALDGARRDPDAAVREEAEAALGENP